MSVLYQEQELIRVVNADGEKRLQTIPRFFLDQFFTSKRTLSTRYARIERRQTKTGLASFVFERSEANVVGHSTPDVRVYETPLIKEKIPWSAEDLLELSGSANVIRVGDESKQAAIDRKVKDDLTTLKSRAEARAEMCAIGTLSGGWSYSGNGVSVTVDFEFPNECKPVLTGGDKWDEATANITGDMIDWFNTVERYSSGGIRMAVFGRNSFEKFAKDEAVMKEFNNLNIRTGALDMNVNTRQKGTFRTVPVWSISEYALDANGNTIDLVNPNGVWIIGEAMETDIVYGVIPLLEDNGSPVVAQVPYYSRQYVEGKDTSTLFTLLVSRPMPIIANPGSVVYATVM